MALDPTIARQRRELRANERALRGQIIRAYARIRKDLQRDLKELEQLIANAVRQGTNPKPSWLHKQLRYQELLEQTELRVAQFIAEVNPSITQAQFEAVRAAGQHTHELTLAALGPGPRPARDEIARRWVRLPTIAVEHLVGKAHNGTPLGDVLNRVAPRTKDTLAQVLTDGVARGRSPRVIARTAAPVMDAPAWQALRIARHETLMAYRYASHQSYSENADIITSVRWEATLDDRTCMACMVLHGQEFPLDMAPENHITCRCTTSPVTRSWEDLGFEGIPDLRASRPTGKEWFRDQPPEIQRGMMGPGKFDAWSSGEIDLDDLVTRSVDPQWGGMRREASLREALAA